VLIELKGYGVNTPWHQNGFFGIGFKMESNQRIVVRTGSRVLEITLFVVIIGLLVAIVSPGFVSAPGPARTTNRVNNPDAIDAIASQFTAEINLKAEAVAIYDGDLTPYVRPGLAVSVPDYLTVGIYTEMVAGALPAPSLDDLATASRPQP